MMNEGGHRYTDINNPLDTINQCRISFPLKAVHIKGTSASRHELNMLIGVAFWWPSYHRFAYVDVMSVQNQ